jgi:hypothetical protein
MNYDIRPQLDLEDADAYDIPGMQSLCASIRCLRRAIEAWEGDKCELLSLRRAENELCELIGSKIDDYLDWEGIF